MSQIFLMKNIIKSKNLYVLLVIYFIVISCATIKPAYIQYVEKGRLYFDKNDYQLAIDNYINALEHIDNQLYKAEVNYQIALCYFILKEYEDSGEYFKAAKKLDSNIFLTRTYLEQSSSMSPTINIGEMFMADKDYYKHKPIKRFDIVIFNAPESNYVTPLEKNSNILVKRVVGLPGEFFEIKDGSIFINGTKINESYTIFKAPEGIDNFNFNSFDNYKKVTIPENYYFLMGDNRYCSWDGRHFGYIKKDDIISKPVIIYGISSKYLKPGMSVNDRKGKMIK